MPIPDSLELTAIGSLEPRPDRGPDRRTGRPMGHINRITRDLKLGIIDAAVAYGSDGNGAGGLTGYLFHLAGNHPKAFAGLLGKMLPLQVNSNITATVGTINVVAVPVDRYLSADDVRKIAEPPVIEHEPAETDEPVDDAA